MSYEIELKAHVFNRDEVISRMNASSAEYGGHTEKKDVYYSFPLSEKVKATGQNYLTARIRREVLKFNQIEKTLNYFTYKRKKIVKGADGSEIEVNDENEFTFEGSTNPLEVFFEDLNGTITLQKEKIVEQWMINVDGEDAHVELCTVPPLGDFLEIEIVKDTNDAETVKRCKRVVEGIFEMCNIPLSQIENRPYRELLQKN